MEVFMFRKVIVALGSAALVAASITVVPANAVTKISNGVACNKAGATTKVKSSTYRCAKNPLVKNAKLTWLSIDCIKTANTYNKTLANLPKIKTATDATLAKLDEDIAKQTLQEEKASQMIPEYRAKMESITALVNVLKADTANLVKNKKIIDNYTSAVRNYDAAIKAYTTVGRQSDRSKTAREQALMQYENSKTDVKTSLGMAKLICTKGF
jgi:hypothetical protein